MSDTTSAARRLFAVVPAAGHARRMGRPKLLLPVGGGTVIGRLLDALDHPRVEGRFVVVRKDDEPLATAAGERGATVVRPEVDPPDMRASVEHALRMITDRFAPRDEDGWMLVPADHPSLTRSILDRLIAGWEATDAPVVVPSFEGRRGHPTIFRWRLAAAVADIPADRGLDHLVAAHASRVQEIAIDDRAIVTDLDTPEDYARLLDESDE